MLAELQPQSAHAVAAALAAHTHAAAAGMVPVFQLAAQAAHIPLGPADMTSQQAGCQVGTAAASCPETLLCSSSGSSSSIGSRASGWVQHGYQPSLLHLATQLGCFPGAPSDVVLPWLQLLTRYHCLAEDVSAHCTAARSTKSDDRSGSVLDEDESKARQFDPAVKPQARVAAMAVALQSLGVPLPRWAACLCSVVQRQYAGHDNVLGSPAIAEVARCSQTCTRSSASSSSSSLQAGELGQCLRSQQQEQRQGPAGQMDSVHEMSMVGFMLHAERLVQVTPQQWQHQLEETLHSCQGNGSISCNGSTSPSADSSVCHAALLAGGVCDWCTGPMQSLAPQQVSTAGGATPIRATAAAAAVTSQQRAGASSSRSSCDRLGSRGCDNSTAAATSAKSLGCSSCHAVQYCSQACADAAKKVHNANCW